MERPEDAILCARLSMSKFLANLLEGISCSVICMGAETEKIGAFSKLLEHVLGCLGEVLLSEPEKTVELSYTIFGVSDTSCIDLLTYQRKELKELRELSEQWISFTEVEKIDTIIESWKQGYSLPCVTMIRLFIRREDEAMPAAMSTLVLADLGAISVGSQLEKSFANLRTINGE